MTKQVKIRIADIVGGTVWVSTDDAQKVHDCISAELEAGNDVILSFEGRETIITAFLNAAIGQLFSGKYLDGVVEGRVNFSDLSDDDEALIEHAVENAKRYFSNKAAYDSAWKEETDEDE
ncbi:STAS-like domain-containing protein [Pararhodobacter sp.]|uniref:STAS-like domain-containing protein n=1 Tax=Pararhodobacter sp. TaxID=2127056 RepID=UPI002AFEA684|nr:STAS-like domain-containing protein [Pararhodobacter sp.]